MKHSIKLTATFAAALFLVSASGQINRATGSSNTTGSGGAPSVTSECPDDIEAIDDCPITGCGELGDAELNTAKNSEAVPPAAEISNMTLANIKSLAQPARWNTGSNRARLKAAGEGRAVRVMGFLLRVKPEGGESCNCELTARAQTDVHLVLVDHSDDLEQESISAEITPRVRQHQGHDPKWQFKNVNDIEGDYVRVTGLLMLDTKHIRQAHRLSGERLNKGLVRATNWEVHPIIKLEVCVKSIKACKANKQGAWEDF